jgi:hypothetical protein
MTDEQYRAQLVQHAKDVELVLSEVSAATSAFMLKRFRLEMYPLTWIREMATHLEQFKRDVELEVPAVGLGPALVVHVDVRNLADEVLRRLTTRLTARFRDRHDVTGFVGGGELGDY